MIIVRRQQWGRAAASFICTPPPPARYTGLPHSAYVDYAAASGRRHKSTRTTVRFDELPSSLSDVSSQPVKELSPWSDTPQTRSRSRKGIPVPSQTKDQTVGIDAAQSDEEAYQAAILAGAVPRSPLAKEVFLNWRRFPECIVLTRVGKFYESYFSPAIHLSQLLSLKLAYKRYSEGVFPFSGFPVHQLDKYLKILVQDLGHTVVLVEEYDEEGNKELLDPVRKKQGGPELKERKVGRVVTPGTLVDESWLAGDESRYLLSIAMESQPDQDDGKMKLALAYTDASTGDFFLKTTDLENIEDELARIAPKEIVLDRSLRITWENDTHRETSDDIGKLLELLRVMGIYISFADPFDPPSMDGTSGISTPPPSNPSLDSLAIGLLRHHLQFALRDEMPDLDNPIRQSSSKMMQIDAATLHALEIRHAVRPSGLSDLYERHVSLVSARGTLLSVVGRTVTPGGHRLLVRTLIAPSTDIVAINSRLDLVEAFMKRQELRLEVREKLKSLVDVRRIVQRFKGRRGDGRDAWDVGRWIRASAKLMDIIRREINYEASSGRTSLAGHQRLIALLEAFQPLEGLAQRLEESIDEEKIMQAATVEEDDDAGMDEAADAILPEEKPKTKKDRESRREQEERLQMEKEAAKFWMKPSFSEELQKLHNELDNLRARKNKMQAGLREKYDVSSLALKKSRNSYIMTLSTKSEFAKIDKSRRFASIREGTGGKTYVYNEWSALGAKTETHIEDMLFAQRRAFDQLRQMIIEHAPGIQQNAELLDELDLTMGFAQVAVDYNYVRPTLNDSINMEIINARHPVVESSLLSSARLFTSNSTSLTPEAHLHVITGPNQGGKSTLLRQTAIIAILAQSGCYVPADKVDMGIVDRVFSRIGARDDLYRDRSTFMLEMVETAAILRHATPRSLVIMDEIGRGTTLNSGLSIAYATLDYILSHIRCRTLFATHYHELASMLSASPISSDTPTSKRAGVAFWCTDVDEVDGAFAYSYKLKPGINYRSHAIKAARLAGMPESFISTAETTLKALDPNQLSAPSLSKKIPPAVDKARPVNPSSPSPVLKEPLHPTRLVPEAPPRTFIPAPTSHVHHHVASK